MRQIVLLGLYLMMGVCIFSSHAEEREVVFRIDGKATSVGEFAHYYARIHAVNGISPEDFLPHFLYYKLKVADARKKGWDTLPDFRLQCDVLQRELEKTEKRKTLNPVPMKWVRFRQISILLPQHVSAAQERRARQSMDSVYAALKGGAAFETVAQNYPLFAASPYTDGEWIPEVCLVKEFSAQLDTLKKNEYSAPFFSPLGVHVVCLLDTRQGYYPESDNVVAGGAAGSPVTDEMDCRQDIVDGLLAAYWDKRHTVASSGAVSDKDLADYFEAHKKDYAWELPHFKGGVIHCLNKKAAAKLKKRLKKLPLSEWTNEIAKASQENPDLKAEADTGLFQIGTNPYVDKLAFKCGHLPSRTELPYTFILGKRLKKGPEEWRDVRGEVLRDYRLSVEKTQMEALKQGFQIEINQDILKTVNCSGKK